MTRSRGVVWAAGAVVAALTGAARPATGQITITPVIVQGQAAPGSTGTFNGTRSPVCQAPGRLAAYAFLFGTPNPGIDSEGVWSASAGGVSLVAILNQPVTGSGGTTLRLLGIPIQNRAGGVTAAGRLTADFSTDSILIYSPTGVGAQIVVREGDGAPGIPGGLFGDVGGVPDLALNDSGRIAFVAPVTGVPAPGNRAMFTGDAATQAYTLLARNGEPSPTPGGAAYTFITSPSINAAGDVSFFSNLDAPPFFTLFLKPAAGPLQAAVSADDPAPGFPAGWTIAYLIGQNSGSPAMNNAGHFAIGGGVRSPSGSVDSFGLWRGAPGALQLIAKKFDPAPGAQPGALFENFDGLINRSGGVLFYANLSFGAQNSGVWTAFPNAAPRLLTLFNGQAPDMPPGVVLMGVSGGGISFNNRAEGLINSGMNYLVNNTPANGLFAGRPGRLRKVVASGDVLEVSPGVFRTAISILNWSGDSPDSGRLIGINDRGEVAFACNFVGGGGGAFIARLPHPCPGDATADDLIGFPDLNAVLASFNTVLGNPAFNQDADFDQDDDVDFADLNAVLAAFNSGC